MKAIPDLWNLEEQQDLRERIIASFEYGTRDIQTSIVSPILKSFDELDKLILLKLVVAENDDELFC